MTKNVNTASHHVPHIYIVWNMVSHVPLQHKGILLYGSKTKKMQSSSSAIVFFFIPPANTYPKWISLMIIIIITDLFKKDGTHWATFSKLWMCRGSSRHKENHCFLLHMPVMFKSRTGSWSTKSANNWWYDTGRTYLQQLNQHTTSSSVLLLDLNCWQA